MDDADLEDALEAHAQRVRRNGLADAERSLRDRRGASAETIIAAFRERVGRPYRSMRGLTDPNAERWYVPRPDYASPRWAYAKTQLGLPREVVDKTSEVADEIVARLGNPLGEEITTRGLVLGHVQSGKTTSFLSVAAKALDDDYNLVIILAGVHNSLRRQTQDRAARTLVHKKDLWWLGTAVGDFRNDGNTLSSKIRADGQRGLLVVKKHATILDRLATWLEEEDDNSLRSLAILVIDDEADQAGLDVSKGGELEGVHKQLSRIVNLQTSDGKRRCAYLAYTATPYANILTSQDEYGLYPKDFIYPLQKPGNYVGSEELFGDSQVGDPVRIENDEGEELLTQGLKDAVRWFVLATAARAGLGTPLESFHSSMLIHTTQSTEEQKAYRPIIEGYLEDLVDEFRASPDVMASFYEDTIAQVPAREEGGEGYVAERVAAWSEVEPHVGKVLRRLLDRTSAGEPFREDSRAQHAHSGVIVDNSKVEHSERLTYSKLEDGEPSVTVIAIGGNTLSRGLTLEGLVCSYFARTARTYDSLMQMGRWFGYRPGYRHLLRVWTTQGLFDWFRELDQVEQDLRRELLWMQDQGLSPEAYGPRIRSSPNMNITRQAAMRSVSREISYSDRLIDPAWLDLDPSALEHNQDLARSLASRLGTPEVLSGGSSLFRGVPGDHIRSFVESFRFHEEEKRLDLPSLKRYMDSEAAKLEHWNVIFKSSGRSMANQFDYGGSVGIVGTVVRGRVANAGIAHIQSLVDSDDHRLDFDGAEPTDGARYRAAAEPPLLVVYAIDPRSEPRRGSNRVPLDAVTTPISASLVMPLSTTYVEYVAPAVARIEDSTLDLGDHHER